MSVWRVTDDRRVHATSTDGTQEIVRYDRSGKWFLEKVASRTRLNVDQVAQLAAHWHAEGTGTVTLGLPGGGAFDRKVEGRIGRRAATTINDSSNTEGTDRT